MIRAYEDMMLANSPLCPIELEPPGKLLIEFRGPNPTPPIWAPDVPRHDGTEFIREELPPSA